MPSWSTASLVKQRDNFTFLLDILFATVIVEDVSICCEICIKFYFVGFITSMLLA
jgi:hypothetical protein